jgi:hypothetical protein
LLNTEIVETLARATWNKLLFLISF